MKVRSRDEALLDFVAVGHVTVDHLASGARIGGAAAFASLSAAKLGFRAGVVSSLASDFPFWDALEGIELHYREGDRTTEFENLYEGEARRQRILAEAAPIEEKHLDSIRSRLKDDASVLYCPVVREIRAPLVPLAGRGLSGVAPQGFFRLQRPDGIVEMCEWAEARDALARADFVSMSENDSVAPEELAEDFPGRAFAITKGERGARVYSQGDIYDLPAFETVEVEPTGAGDVFAAAFLLALREKQSVLAAARFAACAGSFAVEAPGVSGLPTRRVLEARLIGTST
ncbi:MAG: PfkB family carbohydrate kinase [Vicinamibacteria bacterium]